MANQPEIFVSWRLKWQKKIQLKFLKLGKIKRKLDWLRGFLNRNPNVSIRQPEGCSISRATSFNLHNTKLFFDNLEKALKRSTNFFDGSRIYNLDETGTTTVQKPKKVLSEKGIKQCQVTSAERGTLVTTCCIISAPGNTIPPAMVFPRKYFKSHMLSDSVPGTLGLASPSGWMTAELFPQVMEHFIKHSHSTKHDPTILILDNHESHLSIRALDLAKENGVIMITLPPHCSNKMQLLDVSVYFSFKSFYNSAVDSWLLRNPGCPASIYEVASFVKQAHENAMTPINILSGFKKTGIYPFNANIFTESDFLVSSVTDRPFPVVASTSSENNIANLDIQEEILKDKQHPSADISLYGFALSPDVAFGFPKAQPRKGTQKNRKKGKSMIATDTPERMRLFERTSI